jgi:hypothetical protein
MSILTDSSTGLERLGREVVMILHSDLNEELEAVEAEWGPYDEEYAAVVHKLYNPTTLEKIQDGRFYLGHVPSLIDAPIEAFPNIAVMGYQAQNSAPDSIDLYYGVAVSIFIEIMCKSGPYPDINVAISDAGEETVNRRTTRTTDAVVSVLSRNPTLNGLVQPIQTTPSVTIFDVFKRHQNRDRGPLFFWQGSRIEYRVTRLMKGF